MKKEQKAEEIVEQIMTICKCSKEEAVELSTLFIATMLDEMKKLEYYRIEPRMTYWRETLDEIKSYIKISKLWLIELDSPMGWYLYSVSTGYKLTPSAEKALHFLTEEGAKQYLNALSDLKKEDFIVTEHIFM